MSRARKFWGWGYEDYEIPQEMLSQYKQMLGFALGIESFSDIPEPILEDIIIRVPRFPLSEAIETICTSEKFDRLSHSYGKSYRDVWRGLHGQFDNPPDYVAYPKNESDITKLYNFAQDKDIAIVPFGGGSSVTGGVEPTMNQAYKGVISVDMKHFDQVLEVDVKSRTAKIQAGMFGPAIEQALKPYGLTMRHYPQSFEFSTLGGWIVTRSGGHFATLYTHIDEFVQSVTMISPSGRMATRRLPGSGAGPSEERLISGSEGIFGIVTEAWVRLQTIPQYKDKQSVNFAQWKDGVEACRLIAQSGLNPSNARLVSPIEALNNGLGNGADTVLIVGFESHNHQVDALLQEALSICETCNGTWRKKENTQGKDESADSWKKSFLAAPYMRDEILKLGCIAETFETAITWDQFDSFHKELTATANQAIKDICGAGMITCRFTHLYPDGPAPYYTIIARGQTGREMEQWDKIKTIMSNKLIELGATITHHHAVGKDHQPFYKDQMSEPFDAILRSVKKTLDPSGILNPDVLIESKVR